MTRVLKGIPRFSSVLGAGPPSKTPFPADSRKRADQAHKIDASVKQASKASRDGQGGRGAGRRFGQGHGRGSNAPHAAPEKWAAMTCEERAKHHKKSQAACAAKKTKTRP